MSTPRYAHFYDLPEVDSLYDHDPAYTRRCDRVAQEIYKILNSEVRVFLRQPADFMADMTWELCQCIGSLVDSIADDLGYGSKSATETQSLDLFKLSRWFAHYELASTPALRELEKIFTFVEDGVEGSILELAS